MKKYIKRIVKAGNTIEITKYAVSGSRKVSAGESDSDYGIAQKEWKWKRAEDSCRWYLNENFHPGDLWMRFSYPRGTRKAPAEIKVDIEKFFKRLRRLYKKEGKVLKYIYTVGIGSRGGMHFHAVFSEFDSAKIEELWQDVTGTEETPYPSVNTRHLDRKGHYGDVASYLIKNAKESYGTENQVFGKRYCSSRNLAPPKIKRVEVRAGSWTKNPKPKKGYYILNGSVREGKFEKSGFPYQSYIMVRLRI